MDSVSKHPRSKLRRALGNIGVLIFSAAFAYAMGELTVRWVFPQPMLPRYVTDAPYGIRMNQPNRSYWHTSPEYHVNVRTNSRGIRSDREIPYEKPKDTFRIVSLGDSFAMGYEVDLEDTYLYQLEEKLHKLGATNVEVVNLAVSGFGTAEELIALRNEGFKYSPDLVLLGYFVNDIENNITSNLYSLKNDTLKRESPTYLPAMGIRKFLENIPGYQFFAENSQLMNIFRNRISWLVQQGLFRKNRNMEPKGGDENIKTVPVKQDSTTTEYETRLTARLLDEIYVECGERHVPFAILNIPLILTTAIKPYSNFPLHDMRYERDIIVVDPTDVLAAYQHKKEIHFEKWHGHWRPWVNTLVAGILADTIMAHWSKFGTIQEGHGWGKRNDDDLKNTPMSLREQSASVHSRPKPLN